MRCKHLSRHAIGSCALLFTIGFAAPLAAGPRGSDGLIEAVKRADTKAVRALVRARVDPSAPDSDGSTPLHWATHRDDLEVVGVLLLAGANAQAVNRYGITPLWLACVNGNAAVVERLLRAGADPNATRTDTGETPLMIADRSGQDQVVKLLLARGANVNATEPLRGQTALMWAAAERHPVVVQRLIEAGADLKAQSKTKITALMFAIRVGDIECTRRLLDGGASLTETAEDGTSMLVLAILNARFDLAAFLLDRGADPNVNDPHGFPLFVLTWLRRADNRGLTKYLARAPSGDLDSFGLATALLAHGGDINARISWKDPGVSEAGPARGGRVTVPDHMALGPYFYSFAGATAYFIAAMNCDVPFMRFLAEHGADAKIPTRQNVTPLLAASGIGFYEGEHPGTPTEATEAVKLAYDLGNDPKAAVTFGDYRIGSINWNGATALHGAATRGATAMAEWLIEKGVPLDAKTEVGLTAWDIADGSNNTGVFHQWPETAELLRRLMTERGVPTVPAPGRDRKY